MIKRWRKVLISPVLVIFLMSVSLTGCNNYQKAETAHAVAASIIAIAAAEASSIPLADQPIYNGLVQLATTLNANYQTCITNASTGMLSTAGKFLACAGDFAAGFNTPGTLQQLRLLSPAIQLKAQLIITGIIVGINALIAILGGQAQQVPVVSVAVIPTHAQLVDLGRKAGLSPQLMSQAGL